MALAVMTEVISEMRSNPLLKATEITGKVDTLSGSKALFQVMQEA